MILTFSHALFGIWSSKLCGNAHDLFDHSYSSFHSLHISGEGMETAVAVIKEIVRSTAEL